jgi:hypothetical protein
MGKTKGIGGLGYRDLESFNLALLAKQGLRLLQHPDSLAARVIRGKYYPSSGFLDSELGKRPSSAWHSIWNAKALLQKGLIWKVGNGDNIRIWEDKWIPSPHTLTFQQSNHNLGREDKVHSLINIERNWWNVPLVESIFPEDVAALICGIPISPRQQADKLIWAGTRIGFFSV